MSDFYGHGPRVLQDRFDTRRLADRIRERLVRDRFNEDDRAFIGGLDMFFLATVDAEGRPSCSYKGGAPGFVQVVDEATLAFPSFDGNGMYVSMGNVLDTRAVGLLFIDFENQTRLRVEGDATIDLEDPLLAGCPEAQFIVRVKARAVFPNCPRYIHKMQLVERSRFTPRSGCITPVPAWKRSEWAADVVASDDPARDPAREAIRK